MLYQCKAGYERRRPKFEEEYQYIKDNLLKNFPKEHYIHNYPIILASEIDVGSGNKRGPEYTQITMSINDFINLMNGIQPDIFDIL